MALPTTRKRRRDRDTESSAHHRVDLVDGQGRRVLPADETTTRVPAKPMPADLGSSGASLAPSESGRREDGGKGDREGRVDDAGGDQDRLVQQLGQWWRTRDEADSDLVTMMIALPNIAKMLEHRGYDATRFPRTQRQLAVVLDRGRPQCYAKRADPRALIGVMLMPGAGGPPGAPRVAPKIGVDVTRVIRDWADARGADAPVRRCLLVSMAGMTPAASSQLDTAAHAMRIESMCYDDFGYCPVEHRLVPPHRVIPRPLVERFLGENGLVLADLAKQLSTDRVTVYYGLEPGDVVCYRRNNGHQEPLDRLRVVV